MIDISFEKKQLFKNYIIPCRNGETEIKFSGKINSIIDGIIKNEKFKEKDVKKYTVVLNDQPVNFIFVVMPKDIYSNELLVELGHKAMKAIDKQSVDSIFLYPLEEKNQKKHLYTELFIEGMLLGNYRFDLYKSEKEDKSNLVITLYDKKSIREYFNDSWINEIKNLFEAIYLSKNLINMPPNELTPQRFCEIAESVLANFTKITILDENIIKEMGLNLLYTVGKGSENKPKFLIIEYIGAPDVKERFAFVGKGITFDSGGTNLKPTGSIETMKSDMSGAANVLALAYAISKSKLNVNVNFYIPLAENTIGTFAYRPGDIIKSYSGKTVEILNTDAEGRLILADAISYALKDNPSFIIDMATLTGACVVALGSDIAGCFSNNDELYLKLSQSFREKGENITRLPLHKNYKERLKSKNADLQNISKKRTEAGAIMGALFLEEFVGNTPWVHLDIAGTAFMEDNHPVYGEGGSGFGIRSLYDFIKFKSLGF